MKRRSSLTNWKICKMLAVSDAGPIIALPEINRLDILKSLYSSVVITDIVAREAGLVLPEWINVTNDYDTEQYKSFKVVLDAGEASAIAFCLNQDNTVLIIDERKGRKIARENSIEIVGLLGVIVKPQKSGSITDGKDVLDARVNNGFRISKKIHQIVLSNLD